MLDALRFSHPSRERLATLTLAEWTDALKFCDRTQLTLPLLHACREFLPDAIRERIERNLQSNTLRFERIKAAYSDIAASLASADVEFVVLKGFSHAPDFVVDPRLRVQYDIDLFSPQSDSLPHARDALLTLGYEPLQGFEKFPIDHLPAMILKTGWEWRGDYFDPDIPPSVELHFRLWDAASERFDPSGLDQFWDRRIESGVDGLRFQSFHPADKLGYAALHFMRHMLRGDLRLGHAYELAWFLEHHADEQAFWSLWREFHHASLRNVEAICFNLVSQWFGCRIAPAVSAEITELPANVQRWLRDYASAPLKSLSRPNKDELWLHLSLVDSARDRLSVLRRRLLPARFPGAVDAVNIPDSEITWRLHIRKRVRYLAYLMSRIFHHTRVFCPALWHGLIWWWNGKGLGKEFATFLAASALYDFGLFVFFLLYNLYLLDRGFNETFLGLVTSAMMAGSIAGTIPAAMLGNRIGLRKAMLVCFVSIALISALRVWVISQPALLVFAFLGGFASAIWAVSISPVVALLAGDENRAFGFSLVFSIGIGIGVLGGLAGGALPGWLMRIHAAPDAIHAKQLALFIGCIIAGAAAWPASRLRLLPATARDRKSFPKNPFVIRFLTAVAVWSLATGIFNPFFNAYFARALHAPVQWIGLVFSSAQLAQVIAMLLAPAVYRRFGLITGIMYTQMATALALAGLAAGPAAPVAAFIYTGYVAFQWMSEPGMYSLLMNQVSPAERTGASALNFLVMFSSQALVAAAAGHGFAKFGYPLPLGIAALAALLSALLFRALLRKTADSITSNT